MKESLVSKIQQLSSVEYETLQELDGPSGTLRVRQAGNYRWLQMDDASVQSLVDVNAPHRVLSPSIVLMLMGLAFTSGRERLLNLGLGGGAIERGLCAFAPSLSVSSVEVDPRVVAVSKEHFFLPTEQTIHEQDAEQFIANESGYYDLVLCDLFKDDQLPACTSRGSFFADIERCLSPGGVFVINLLHTDQAALVSTLHAVRAYLPVTWLVEIKGHQNVIAYFTREQASSTELKAACGDILQTLEAEPLTFEWELVSLPVRKP
ncbi:MAG: spermidine synthase [Gammaproteobacteria bacterium]